MPIDSSTSSSTAIIGDNYPVPDRMLVHNEQIVHEYLQWAMCGPPRPKGRFHLYAVEGGTAAMCYIFKSMKANRLLNAGDTIALLTPIFTPYLEMPHLEDYDLKTVLIKTRQEGRFQLDDADLKKLLDPKVKAFFVVNPGNPSAVALNDEAIGKIGAILEKRPELMVLTDDVYGTFVTRFRSLLGAFPRNTIGVYSYSKYFGCTGWRLGVIAVHEDNLFDRLIANHPEHVRKKLDKRYGTLTLEPRKVRFIDRIVADSRDVALNHTAGLSLPQQVMMTLFSLYELMDEKKQYQKACMDIVRKRAQATIEGLDIEFSPSQQFDNYYGLIDFEFWARKYLGEDIVRWMKANVHPLDIVFRLAKDHGIVALNGGGFDAPNWSVRLSFANLDDDVYEHIGRSVRAVARSYRQLYEAAHPKRSRQAQQDSACSGQASATMKRTAGWLVLIALMVGAAALAQQPPALPRVKVLATGGTIAGAQASAGNYSYRSGAYDVNALIAAVPNLDQLAVITGEQVANIGSQDMSDEVWLALAKRVNEVLAAADTDGILITHGTDTLEETSYFLSLVTKSDKPVVMVGSMRPATAISADGPGNIYNGVAVIADRGAYGKGTLVSLNDEIHYARNVVKTDTTSVQTFRSVNRGPAGVVHTGKVEWFEPMNRKVGNATEFSIAALEALPRVDVLYAHANMSADLIDAAVENGAQGIVIAGVGDGNMTAARSTRSPKRRRPASSSCAAHVCPPVSCCATTRSTTTSSGSSRRVS